MTWRELFSDRRFNGFAPLVGRFAVFALVGGALSAFVDGNVNGRLGDVNASLLTYPLFVLIIASFIALILAWATKSTIEAVFPVIFACSPLVLVPPLVDTLVRMIGLTLPPGFVSPTMAWLEIVTFGLFPHPLVSIGLWITSALSVVLLFLIVRSVTSDLMRAFKATLILWVGLAFFFLIPSLLAWLKIPSDLPWATVSPLTLQRSLAHWTMESYWWRNIYERFPVTRGSEVETSLTLWFGALAWLICSVEWALLVRRTAKFSLKALGNFLRWKEGLVVAGIVLLGLLIGSTSKESLTFGFVNATAWLVLLFVLFLLWFWLNSVRDRTNLPSDERLQNDRPLATGALSVTVLHDLERLAVGLALVGAWLLGWPIFLSALSFVLLGWLFHSPDFRKAEGIFRFGWIIGPFLQAWMIFALLMLSWFFLRQNAIAAAFPYGLRIVLFVVCVVLLGVKERRERAML